MDEQQVYTGAGCVAGLPEYLRSRCGTDGPVLLVHGRHSWGASGAAALFTEGVAAQLNLHHFDQVTPNPEHTTVALAAEVYRQVQPRAVVALGGGSVIDTAKGMLAMVAGGDIGDVLANRFSLPQDAPVFVAVPTTAGSGSEATHFAVLYRDHVKYSLANPGLLPQAVWLDPDLLASCPRPLALASAADAICQCVESWWNVNATDESRDIARQGLELLLPLDIDARERTLLGAHKAGQAINLTKTTAGHALSYGLTTTLGIPHGLAVLAVMQVLVQDTPVPELDTLFSAYGTPFTRGFREFSQRIWRDVPLAPAFAGTTEDDVAALWHTVNVERLQNHPQPLAADQIEKIYRTVHSLHAEGTHQ